MLDQRLDPKRERWINAGFVLLTVMIAIALFIIAAKVGLEQNGATVDQSPSNTAQQSRPQ